MIVVTCQILLTILRSVRCLDSFGEPLQVGAGWSCFLVELHGEIVMLVGTQHPAPLLQVLTASRKRQAQDLVGRRAMFMTPVATA